MLLCFNGCESVVVCFKFVYNSFPVSLLMGMDLVSDYFLVGKGALTQPAFSFQSVPRGDVSELRDLCFECSVDRLPDCSPEIPVLHLPTSSV